VHADILGLLEIAFQRPIRVIKEAIVSVACHHSSCMHTGESEKDETKIEFMI